MKHELLRVARDHRLLIGLVVAHALAVPLLLWWAGLSQYYRFPIGYLVSPGWLGPFILITGLRAYSDRTPITSHRLGSSVLVYVLFGLAIATFISAKQSLLWLVPYDWDVPLADLDARLHGGRDAWTLFQWMYGVPALIDFIDFVYLAWAPLFLTVTYAVAYQRPSTWRTQYLITSLVLWAGLGNVLAAFFGAGGPCYYAEFTGDQGRFAPLLAALSDHDTRARMIQHALWAAAHSGGWTPLAGISAMPSLHVAVATLMAIVAWSSPHRWMRGLGIAFALTIQIASVVLGWHYAIDGYVGAVLAVRIWRAVGYWLRHAAAEASQLSPAMAIPQAHPSGLSGLAPADPVAPYDRSP